MPRRKGRRNVYFEERRFCAYRGERFVQKHVLWQSAANEQEEDDGVWQHLIIVQRPIVARGKFGDA